MANKCDIVKEDPAQRKVSMEEISNLVKYNGLIYVGESSAKEDINIKEVFETLLTDVHHTQKKFQQQKQEEALRLGQRTFI